MLNRDPTSNIERLQFRRADGKRVWVVWNWNRDARSVSIPALGTSGQLFDQSGAATTVLPVSGSYSLSLPGATNFNSHGGFGAEVMIGGWTYILVEQPAPTATPTLTATPTPTPTLVAGCSNLIANGSFEDDTAWTRNNAAFTTFDHLADAGQRSAFVGIVSDPPTPATVWSSLAQTVTLPISATQITAGYALRPVSNDPDGDRQLVRILSGSETVVVLEDFNPAANEPVWRARVRRDITEQLRPYRGRPITFYFAVVNDGDGQGVSYLRVDDVSLVACVPLGGAATTAPTATPGPPLLQRVYIPLVRK